MTLWEFINFWDHVQYTALQNHVEASFQEVPFVDAISFHVRNPQTKKVTTFYISKLGLENLGDDAKRILTEKLLDMIREVKE